MLFCSRCLRVSPSTTADKTTKVECCGAFPIRYGGRKEGKNPERRLGQSGHSGRVVGADANADVEGGLDSGDSTREQTTWDSLLQLLLVTDLACTR